MLYYETMPQNPPRKERWVALNHQQMGAGDVGHWVNPHFPLVITNIVIEHGHRNINHKKMIVHSYIC